jgi:hypothetical protein
LIGRQYGGRRDVKVGLHAMPGYGDSDAVQVSNDRENA